MRKSRSRKKKPPKRVLALPVGSKVALDEDRRQGGCLGPPWATDHYVFQRLPSPLA
jgi:hypothetical protein